MRAIFDKYTATCAGCGKTVMRPYKWQEFIDAWRAAKDKEAGDAARGLREGVSIQYAAFVHKDEGDVIVCPGRQDRTPSEVCRVAALKKLGRCPLCGDETRYRWPLPCDQCTGYAEAGYARAALDKERGDRKVFLVQTVVEGLYGGFRERRLSEVFSELFRAFGVEINGGPVAEVLGWKKDWNTPDGVRALLDAKQAEAVTELFRWLNVATADALSEAHKRGAELLTQLVQGKLTFDALNDSVTDRIRRYQEVANKIKEEPPDGG